MSRRTAERSPLRSILVLATVILCVLGLVAVFGAFGKNAAQQVLGPRVPDEFKALILEAAERCPAVPAEILAAQINQESGWDPAAVSPVGARGIAQFMPGTWKQYGLDGNDDGSRDVWDPQDAIHSAAALNCVNRKLVKGISGDRVRNTLAAYNAGFGAVMKYDGVPPFPETQAYVERILDAAKKIDLN